MLLFHDRSQLGKVGQFAQTWRILVLMPVRKPNLTPELDHFVAVKIETDLYANASQGMGAALRLLELDEREREENWQRFVPQLKLESPVSSIQAGEV
jgi:Arc/MetJ-type ribon-helix-helix transcriptional regulator